MLDPKRILVLAPHTDDGELGCGATIAKYHSEQREIYYVAFCLCSQSLPGNLPPDTLEKECQQATSFLGIAHKNLILFNYEVRNLPQVRQQILEELLKLNKEIKPDMVFLPAASDVHQDHHVVHQEGLRAFKNTTLAGYELPWNNYSFSTNFFIKLSEEDVAKKIDALKHYKSQSHRPYMKEEFVRSLATIRGVQCGNKFAEAFEIYRLIS